MTKKYNLDYYKIFDIDNIERLTKSKKKNDSIKDFNIPTDRYNKTNLKIRKIKIEL